MHMHESKTEVRDKGRKEGKKKTKINKVVQGKDEGIKTRIVQGFTSAEMTTYCK